MRLKTVIMKSKKRVALVAFLLTSFLIAFVTACAFNKITDAIVDWELKDKLSLRKGTIGYKNWKEPPVPIAFNVYVFDITNPEEVAAGQPPNVVEKGPYVQRMHIHKEDIVYHHNDTVSYIQPQAYHFDREASVGSLNDTFTNINIPYLTMVNTLQSYSPTIQIVASGMFKALGETPLKKLTVNDIFWGYKDPILGIAQKLVDMFHMDLPYITAEFGFFYDKNNTGDGLYNVFSGLNGNLDNYCEIDLWNKTRMQNIWSTPEANKIEGTDGSMHPPYVSSDSILKIFDAYLRRVLHLEYVRKSSFKGLDTLRFVVPFSDFANAKENPSNAGFCTPNTDHCIQSGCLNLSVASFGAPMYISMPHFVGGDPYYQRQVVGLSPDPEKHQPFYDIHALTGVSIQGGRRYQINVRTQQYKHFDPVSKFPVAYVPIIWIDGMSVIDDDSLSPFRDQLQPLMNSLPYIRGGMFGLSVLFLLLTCCFIFYWLRKDKAELVKSTIEKVVNDNDTDTASEKDPLLKGRP